MIRNRDIIVVGLQPWDIKIGSNCKNIAMEFSKFNRVLYVNPPVDQITRVRKGKDPDIKKRLEFRKRHEYLFPVAQNLWTLYPGSIIRSANWLPSTRLFRTFNRWNNEIFSRDIRKAIAELSFRDFILFNDSDMFRSYHLKEMLKPAISIYYSRDNLMAYPYWSKHGRYLEPELMKKSDLVLANSAYLADYAKQYNPNSFDVGQGCDLSLFDPGRERPVPADLAVIKKPVIGYIGAILSLRLNLDLLLELCKRKEEWSFVFVGKTDESFQNSDLKNMSNVHFPGLKKESSLPDYLAHFDVAINPQQINEFTIGNYPRKIDEYLAMGKPVVATDTMTMSLFRDFCYLGKTTDDYIALIEKALRENNPDLEKQRIQFARTHTWENSVKSIQAAIIKLRPGLTRE
jgi:glycosyltransferase involved in cell wall biosynthesis